MLTFFRLIRGYYYIWLSGYSPERFFNLCRLNGIVLWDIETGDEYYSCKLQRSDYKKIQPFLEKTKVIAEIKAEYGLPFFMQKNKKRKIFLLGIICAFGFIYGMSFFIWSFSVEGNEKIEDAILCRFVNSLGISYGTYKNDVDIEKMEEEIREYFDGISWVSIRISGTELIISIKENYVSIGREQDNEGFGEDLLSGTNGIVVNMITREGVPKVKVGDEVMVGTVLVEGKVPIFDNDGNVVSYDLVNADADVVIRTEYPIHREISRYYRHKNYTGNEIKIPYIRFGSHFFSITYYKDQFVLYDVIVNEKTNPILEEFSIPIYWGSRRYCEYVEIEDLYGDEEGIIILKKFLDQTIEELSEKGVQIIENNVKIETDSQYLKLTGYLLIDILQQES